MSYHDPNLQRYRLLVNDPMTRRDYTQPYKGDLPIKLNRILNPTQNLDDLSFLSQDTANTSLSITPRNIVSNERTSLKKEMDHTLRRIDEFYGQMRSLENMTLSLRQRLDEDTSTLKKDQVAITSLIRGMNEKFKGLDSFIGAVKDTNGQILDIIPLNGSLNDSSENIQIIKEDISELKNHAKARMREEETFKWDLVRLRNNYDQLQKEFGEEKVKKAVLEKEKEMLERENKRLAEELSHYQQRFNQGPNLDVYGENNALKDRAELLLVRIRELEKENARIRAEGLALGRDNTRLLERLKIQERNEEKKINYNRAIENENMGLKQKVIKTEKEKFMLAESLRKFERELNESLDKSKRSGQGVNIKRSNDNLLRSQLARLSTAYDPNQKLNLMKNDKEPFNCEREHQLMSFGQVERELMKKEREFLNESRQRKSNAATRALNKSQDFTNMKPYEINTSQDMNNNQGNTKSPRLKPRKRNVSQTFEQGFGNTSMQMNTRQFDMDLSKSIAIHHPTESNTNQSYTQNNNSKTQNNIRSYTPHQKRQTLDNSWENSNNSYGNNNNNNIRDFKQYTPQQSPNKHNNSSQSVMNNFYEMDPNNLNRSAYDMRQYTPNSYRNNDTIIGSPNQRGNKFYGESYPSPIQGNNDNSSNRDQSPDISVDMGIYNEAMPYIDMSRLRGSKQTQSVQQFKTPTNIQTFPLTQRT